MKYFTVYDVMESLPHPVLPTVQGEPDYQTIHPTRKFLQANSRAIDIHLGGGTLGHLGLIISDSSYTMIAPTTDEEPTLWITPQSPGRAPVTPDGTADQISAARHIWEEDVQTYRTCTSVQQALKKQIISVFEPVYLDIFNDNMVGYANILARCILHHLFETYRNITAVDLEINFEPMRWLSLSSSRFKIVPTILKQGELSLVTRNKSKLGMQTYLQPATSWAHVASGTRNTPLKNLDTIQIAFCSRSPSTQADQGESAATAGYNSESAAVTHNEDQMAEATILALENIATATVADRGVVVDLTQANSRLAKQLEDNSSELRELNALLNKERREKRFQRSLNPLPINYFWTHGYKIGSTHTSLTCKLPKPGHKTEATREDNTRGSQANREWCSGAAT
jgi:hypothetical protein